MTDQELAFAAGLLEGEGCVRIAAFRKRNHGALEVSVVNTNRQLVEWLAERWPATLKDASVGPGRRPAWVWRIAARRALAFLEEVEPFVISGRMRERIATARWWQQLKAKHWSHRREADRQEAFECWLWMAELNGRGKP